MKHIKLFEKYNETITLYHGTCAINGKILTENGWKPNLVGSGSNQGNPNYLYLTTEIEDARWFAEEKGCDTVLEIQNIPIEYLRFDPEDECADLFDYSISNAISKLKNGYPFPIKFALTKELSKEHFNIL